MSKYKPSQYPNPFRLDPEELHLSGLSEKAFKLALPALSKLLGLKALADHYDKLPSWAAPEDFFATCLADLDISYQLHPKTLSSLPKDKPLIIVANHPFGALEALIMYDAFRKMRPDLKFLANFILGRIKPVSDLFILVDPFETKKAVKKNVHPLRESISWLNKGHSLITFPAGTVSHLHLKEREVIDPVWNTNIAKLARKTQATVLPCFIHGRNSLLFQAAGLVHPLLRTLLLPRQLLNKAGKQIDIQIGQAIEYDKLERFSSDRERTDYIRMRCYMQKNSLVRSKDKKAIHTPAKNLCPVIEPVDENLLRGEVEQIPESNKLIDKEEHAVFITSADASPYILREIGRLREITFREVGEGTGKEYDLDFYDNFYTHLFVWHKSKGEIVGAYRLVQADKAIERYGLKGLYTHSLFRYDKPLLLQMGPSIEVGRSFVKPEYQKSFWALLMLWKGLTAYVYRNPEYKTLFGPVSISDSYDSVSRQLLKNFIEANNYEPNLAKLVSPRFSHRPERLRGVDKRFVSKTVKDLSEVAELISDIELREESVPVLLKEYIKLGGKIIGFNVDPSFSSVLDGLIVVDLSQANPLLLRRYMGRKELNEFLAYHHGSETESKSSKSENKQTED